MSRQNENFMYDVTNQYDRKHANKFKNNFLRSLYKIFFYTTINLDDFILIDIFKFTTNGLQKRQLIQKTYSKYNYFNTHTANLQVCFVVMSAHSNRLTASLF